MRIFLDPIYMQDTHASKEIVWGQKTKVELSYSMCIHVWDWQYMQPSSSLTPAFRIPSIVSSCSSPVCAFSTSFSYFNSISTFAGSSIFFIQLRSKDNLSELDASNCCTMLGQFTFWFLASQNLRRRMCIFLQLLLLINSSGTFPSLYIRTISS